MPARSSVCEERILLTKPFQASQSWHQLSVYENKILVQNCLLNEWTLVGDPPVGYWSLCQKNNDCTSSCPEDSQVRIVQCQFLQESDRILRQIPTGCCVQCGCCNIVPKFSCGKNNHFSYTHYIILQTNLWLQKYLKPSKFQPRIPKFRAAHRAWQGWLSFQYTF